MRTQRLLLGLSVLALGLATSQGLMAKQEKLPEVTEEGLHLIHDSELAVVYADPDADLTPYTKVQLLDTYVAFKKNWKRDMNRSSRAIRVTDQDMERIKARMAKEFTAVFTQVLEEDDGYPVVDAAGPDVLLIRPAIINLNPNAPDTRTAGMVESYAQSAGDMTLYIEIYDSVTGALIAKGLDRQADRQNGYMTWQNSVSNKAAADRILKAWAGVLRAALDEAHAHGGTAAVEQAEDE